jgi:hypothetical protein
LLHGWKSGLSHRFRFPWIARWVTRAGFNAATLELPYNFQRPPRRPGGLLTPYFLRLAEMRAQAVVEIRALTGWLLEQGCPAVALWGGSYGGWLAGLTVCRDAWHEARPAPKWEAGMVQRLVAVHEVVSGLLFAAWHARALGNWGSFRGAAIGELSRSM